MKARLTFLTGPRRGRRVIIRSDAYTIDGERSIPEGPLARIDKRAGTYWLTSALAEGRVRVNGTSTQESALQDGDLLRLAGQKIRFTVVPDRHEECKPMRHILRRSWQAAGSLETGRVRRALFLVRDLCHCTWHDARPIARLGSASTLALMAAAVVVASVSLFQARTASKRVLAVSARLAANVVSRERLQQEVVGLRQREGEKAETRARLGQVAENLRATEHRLTDIERQTSSLLTVIEATRQSVAFVVVGYAMYEADNGKPLRYVSVDSTGAPQRNGSGTFDTSVDGAGPAVVSYVTGSGFLVGHNRLITNHHVAQPWWHDESADAAIRGGFEPKYTAVRAYFPGADRPVDLRVIAVSANADVAVLEGPIPSGRRPLKLAAASRPVSPGDPIVVVGYPTGLNALLAKLGEQGVQELAARVDGSTDPAELADALARKRLISPLVTMGHVGDVVENNIVYDAATAHGSSGGPVLNALGEVVALNYAALDGFAGGAFGIPVRFVRQALTSDHHRSR
ncbi:MAG: trypsin-like peptidase domain-containing protein [Acidobacteria bacterium]|nr:trypsin-like peptidase domain-containing protein [Acidobacteriota bacterium]